MYGPNSARIGRLGCEGKGCFGFTKNVPLRVNAVVPVVWLHVCDKHQKLGCLSHSHEHDNDLFEIYYNSFPALMRYFDVNRLEFRDFWVSLSDDEKDYYRTINLDG